MPVKAAPATAMERIFAAISEYSRTMGDIHGDYMKIVRRDIENFEKISGDISDKMLWESRAVIGLSLFAASFAVAGSLLPKGSDDYSSLPFGEKITNSEFLRNNCKTAYEAFKSFPEGAKIWYDSQTSQLGSKKELIQTCLREGQGEKTTLGQEMKRAQETALSILQSKAKGG